MVDIANLNITKALATDDKKQEQGVWVPIGEFKFLVRRFKSKFVQDARTEIWKPFVAILRRQQELPEAQSIELLNKLIARAVIANWEGIKDNDGVEFPCTYENRLALIKALPDLRDDIISYASDRDAFKADEDEAALGNSPAT